MRLQVLCTTMHQEDFSKIEEMHIASDAVFANQADKNGYAEMEFDGHIAKMITTDTRGLAINRNIAIMYSDSDIIIFADDDQLFVDDYEKLILNEFQKYPEADAIKFLCKSTNPKRPLAFRGTTAFKRMRKHELMSAGVHALAIRRSVLEESGVLYRHNIGAGRELYCGEDSVFYSDLLRSGVKIYSSPTFVSYVKQEESSWFKGYSEQFFISIGYLYKLLYGVLAPLAMIRRILRIKTDDYTKMQMFALMRKGAKRAKYRK